MPFITALRRQSQADFYEFEASLDYQVSSRTTKATHNNPVLKNQNQQQQKKLEIFKSQENVFKFLICIYLYMRKNPFNINQV